MTKQNNNDQNVKHDRDIESPIVTHPKPKGKNKKVKPNFKGKKNNSSIVSLPDYFKDKGKSTGKSQSIPKSLQSNMLINVELYSQQDHTDDGKLLTKNLIEFVKFSPLGEEGSIIRTEFKRMIDSWMDQMRINNVEYSFKRAIPELTVTMFDEYFEMCCNLYITYRMYKFLYNLSSARFTDTEHTNLRRYAAGVTSQMTGLRQMLNVAENQIRNMHIPKGLLKLMDETFGFRRIPTASSRGRIECLGVYIPMNYPTYQFKDDARPFQVKPRKGKTQPGFEGITIPSFKTACENFFAPEYNPLFVNRVPPVSDEDIIRGENTFYNFVTWANQPKGVYNEITNLFTIVCPQWKIGSIADYDPLDFEQAENEWISLVENYNLLDQDEPDRIAAEYIKRDSFFSMIVHPDRELTIYNLFKTWNVMEIDDFDEDGKPIVTPVNFPGLIIRIASHDEFKYRTIKVKLADGEENTYDSLILENPRYRISITGSPVRVTGTESLLSLNRVKVPLSRSSEYLEFRNIDYNIRYTPTLTLVERAKDFVEYIYDNEAIVNSKRHGNILE